MTRKVIEKLPSKIEYQKRRRIILVDRVQQDDASRQRNWRSPKTRWSGLRVILGIGRQTLDYLMIRAPVSGDGVAEDAVITSS